MMNGSLMLRYDLASSESIEAFLLDTSLTSTAKVERKHIIHLSLGQSFTSVNIHTSSAFQRKDKIGWD